MMPLTDEKEAWRGALEPPLRWPSQIQNRSTTPTMTTPTPPESATPTTRIQQHSPLLHKKGQPTLTRKRETQETADLCTEKLRLIEISVRMSTSEHTLGKNSEHSLEESTSTVGTAGVLTSEDSPVCSASPLCQSLTTRQNAGKSTGNDDGTDSPNIYDDEYTYLRSGI